MSVDVIHQLLNLPAIKLKMLFERYIIYRRLKDATGENVHLHSYPPQYYYAQGSFKNQDIFQVLFA